MLLCLEGPVVGIPGPPVEADEGDLVEGPGVGRQEVPHRLHSDGGSQAQGEAIDPGADGGEGHRPEAVVQSQLQAGAVAGGQERPLPRSPPRQMGPGVWRTYLAGRRYG